MGKDKWLCPLSGKKFKGPDFVRKHIFNKHGEKVDEVKKEVQYYNNYLKDPKRPQLPENPKNGADKAGRGGRDGGSRSGKLPPKKSIFLCQKQDLSNEKVSKFQKQIFQPKLLQKTNQRICFSIQTTYQDRKTNSMVRFLEEFLAGKIVFNSY